MFTNYSSLSCRSRSTADLFKASSLDDTSKPPMTYAVTVTRSNSAITTSSFNNRRRHITPKRQNGQVVLSSVLLRPRCDETRRRLIRTSTPTQPDPVNGSSFVKKLVASIERRQKEINDGASGIAGDEQFFKKGEDKIGLINGEEKLAGRADTDHSFNPTHLEELKEDEYEDASDSSDDPPMLWSADGYLIPAIFSVNGDVSDDPPEKPSFQRTLKNVVSSIWNWRLGGSKQNDQLPKGTREYYAARESLGDEMLDFRKNTMPKLMKSATRKGGLDRSNGETARRHLREFSNFVEEHESKDTSGPSTATILPVYGTVKRSASARVREPVEKENDDDDCVIRRRAVQMRKRSPPRWRPCRIEYMNHPRWRAMMEKSSPDANAASTVYEVPRSNYNDAEIPSPSYENLKPIAGNSEEVRSRNACMFNRV